MAKINLSEGWFDDEKAIAFEESTRWNGQNHISCATGSQWEHEKLYFTKSGRWVLHAWSQYQGSTPSYDLIDEEDAMAWLSKHADDAALERLPAEVLARADAAHAAAEV